MMSNTRGRLLTVACAEYSSICSPYDNGPCPFLASDSGAKFAYLCFLIYVLQPPSPLMLNQEAW